MPLTNGLKLLLLALLTPTIIIVSFFSCLNFALISVTFRPKQYFLGSSFQSLGLATLKERSLIVLSCFKLHTKRQVYKWKFLQHALSRYVYNRIFYVVLISSGKRTLQGKCSFVRFICSDNLPTLGLVKWSHVAESCWFLWKVLWGKENKMFFSRSFVSCIYNLYLISIFIFISATFLFHFYLIRAVVEQSKAYN